MRRLKTEEFLPHALGRKGTVRVNHDAPGCSGESRSLKVTTDEYGNVSAKCFRCGLGGYHGAVRHFHRGRFTAESVGEVGEQVQDGYRLPADLTDQFPGVVSDWLRKAGLEDSAVIKWGFRWSPSKATLYIPVEQEISAYGPKLAGYVLRGFDPKSYLTLTHASAGFWGLYRGPESHSGRGGTLALVEDVLSARRCSQFCDSLALCGTSLRPEAFQYVLEEGYKEAVIYLDGDNPQVQTQARKLARSLGFMQVRIIETGTDPKREPNERLGKLLSPIDLSL